jgi:outer membrane protein
MYIRSNLSRFKLILSSPLRTYRNFALLAAILLITGCLHTTSPGPIDAQVYGDKRDMPEPRLAQSANQSIPLQISTNALPLPEWIDLALEHNPTLQQARLSAQAAAARTGQAVSRFYPAIGIRAEGSLRSTHDGSIGDDTTTVRYGPSANLTWLLLDFGGRRATLESARHQLLAGDLTVNKVYQDLIANVQRAYFDLVAADVGVEVAEAILAAAEQTMEAASRKRTAGLGIELDVLQAKSGEDRARHALQSAKGTLQVARGTMAHAIGLPADTHIAVAPPNDVWESTLPADEQQIRQLIERALQLRPDVAALAANRDAQQAALDAARSSRWPSLVANASASQYASRYSGTNIDDRDVDEYLVALALDWNLFDGGLHRWQIKEAQAALTAAELALHAKELSVSAEVWRAFHTWQSAWHKMNYSKDFLKTAQAAFDLATRSYESGLRDIISLLNAQSNLAAARTDWVYTRRELHVALADLANTIGDIAIAPDGTLPHKQAP